MVRDWMNSPEAFLVVLPGPVSSEVPDVAFSSQPPTILAVAGAPEPAGEHKASKDGNTHLFLSETDILSDSESSLL